MTACSFKVTSGVEQKQEEMEAPNIGRFAQKGMSYNVLPESDEIQNNPHQGWMIHYYDNSSYKYGAKLGPDMLEDFPGLNIIYLRLAWSHFESEEGKFNWDLFDKQIERWTAAGKRIALRVTSCETLEDQFFATPEWVKDAGAKGQYYKEKYWEPDYDDPVFLEKLENFIAAFAAKYDGQPFIEFVDMGSYGVWGEWHTSGSTKRTWPAEVQIKHIDLYKKYFKNTQLLMLYGADEKAVRYALENCGTGLRNDSIGGVSEYLDFGGFYRQELFEEYYLKNPICLELCHGWYFADYDNWDDGLMLQKGVERLHASWITCHDWPREWLNENKELAGKLARRIGYQLYLNAVVFPESAGQAETITIQFNFENRGVAPLYQKYPLALSFINIDTGFEIRQVHSSFSISKVLPDTVSINNLKWLVPENMPSGKYNLSIGLVKSASDLTAAINLCNSCKNDFGYYDLGEVEILT
ncbi:MAG: DUF4832 domain-containing protein [Planctomycetota bacterium]|jgi:hypothetical protein